MTKAIETFNFWAEKNKDLGMEKNHTFSVNKMLELIPSHILSKNFSFIDIGCGNGWVVRKLTAHSLCHHANGIDGAEEEVKDLERLLQEAQDRLNKEYENIGGRTWWQWI